MLFRLRRSASEIIIEEFKTLKDERQFFEWKSDVDPDLKGMGRYLGYQFDDILEFWNAEKKKSKKMGIILRCVCGKDGMTKVMQIVVHEILRIQNLYRNCLRDGMENADGEGLENAERVDERFLSQPPKVKHFVGRKEDLEKLVSILTDSKQPQFVFLLGEEGLGKTVLATKIFMEDQVRRHFDAFVWVSLTQGQDYKMGDIMQNIRDQLYKSSKFLSSRRILQAYLRRESNFLIVIDGIWEISQWRDISSTRTMSSHSRILLTTRNETIACDDNGVVHKLTCLNENDGWELLQKHAFSEDVCPVKGLTRRLGKEMVRKCKYLPSTISRLGRALSKINTSEWQSVNDDVSRYLEVDEQGKGSSSEKPSVIVAPRYDRLRFHLKQCFLYLGIFNQDIDAEDLTFLWAAEGMLLAQQGDTDNGTIIDTAQRYLQELNSKGMLKVEVDELSTNRIVMPLSLHNNHWALSRYQGEKEDFDLHVSDNAVVDVSDNAVVDNEKISLTRRLVFHFNKQATSSSTDAIKSKNIRSLFFLNSDEEYVDLPVCMSRFEKLKLLRTVHFVRCKFEGRKLPEEIEKLVRLRYLGIIYCDLDSLSSSLSNFRNLHVLNVRANDDTKMTIPDIFSQTSSQLTQMKHLRLPSNLENKQSHKLKLDGLSDLETLVGFNVKVHDIGSLSNLSKLQLLVTHVADNDSLEPIIDFVTNKRSTVNIHIIVECKCNFTSQDELAILEDVLMCPLLYALTFSMVHMHSFPNCRSFASARLTQIKLIGCRLREDPMEALANFPNLRKLYLGYGAFVGSTIEIHLHQDGGFEKLEYLEFRCLPKWKEWVVSSGATPPTLSTLTVKRCPKLEQIPEGLTSVSSLKNFEIELPPSALSEAKKKEYRQKFSTVTNFVIRPLDPSSSARTD